MLGSLSQSLIARKLSLFSRLLKTVRRGAAQLDLAAVGEISAFLESHRLSGGGFRGRGREADLYYSMFAQTVLVALGKNEDEDAFFRDFGRDADLDLVHLATLMLARSRLLARRPAVTEERALLLGRLEAFRGDDGSFGTPYADYLALVAQGALGVIPKNRRKLAEHALTYRASDGSFANERGSVSGTVPTTVAALVLLQLGRCPLPGETVAWLTACQTSDGGFSAVPGVPADLLSTACACFALREFGGVNLMVSPIADFVESCWGEDGGFAPCPGNPDSDAEYCFYALLALGSLCPS